MKAILIIAHHCILPGAYKGFEGILDKLHHDLPGTRVASTSLLDLENDLRTLLREDVESVTDEGSQVTGEKFFANGRLYIRRGAQVFDMMGQPVK